MRNQESQIAGLPAWRGIHSGRITKNKKLIQSHHRFWEGALHRLSRYGCNKLELSTRSSDEVRLLPGRLHRGTRCCPLLGKRLQSLVQSAPFHFVKGGNRQNLWAVSGLSGGRAGSGRIDKNGWTFFSDFGRRSTDFNYAGCGAPMRDKAARRITLSIADIG